MRKAAVLDYTAICVLIAVFLAAVLVIVTAIYETFGFVGIAILAIVIWSLMRLGNA